MNTSTPKRTFTVSRFDCNIVIDEQEPEYYTQAFDRLAGLTKLKILRLSRSSEPETPQLALQIDQGLGLLKSLEGLEELRFDQRLISVEDWDWILVSFPGMQRITSCINTPDDERDAMLAVWMSEYHWIHFDVLKITSKKAT